MIESETVDFLEYVKSRDILDIQMEYVRCFEMAGSSYLYLTAFEYGDSRERGNALIEIKQMIEEKHFKIIGKETPDYIPILLEFMSSLDPGEVPADIETRLHRYFSKTVDKVNSDMYRNIFALLGRVLEESGHVREIIPGDVDTGELPFPMKYDGGEY
jgi:nitrate reductase delta subunit